jgi:DNA primase
MIIVWEKPILASVHDILQQLRTEIRAEGVDLLRDIKPTNKNIMITCPFHRDGKERRPSCGVSTVETKDGNRVHPAGTVHCFTCGYTSDLPEFVSNVLGYNDRGLTGYKWITSRFASVTVEQRRPLKLDMSRDKKKKEDIQYVSEEELEKYRYFHPYMYERKLTDKVIEYFDVGYDEETDSLTFPVHDLTGRVLFIQRRSVGKKSFLNESIAEKGKVVYGLYHVYKNLSWIKEVYITESIIDALTWWTKRIPAVALMGAIPTIHQLKLLEKAPVRKYIVALDNPLIDEAGRNGATKVADYLGRTKLINYLKYPEGVKDTNEMTDEQLEHREISIHRYF